MSTVGRIFLRNTQSIIATAVTQTSMIDVVKATTRITDALSGLGVGGVFDVALLVVNVGDDVAGDDFGIIDVGGEVVGGSFDVGMIIVVVVGVVVVVDGIAIEGGPGGGFHLSENSTSLPMSPQGHGSLVCTK